MVVYNNVSHTKEHKFKPRNAENLVTPQATNTLLSNTVNSQLSKYNKHNRQTDDYFTGKKS